MHVILVSQSRPMSVFVTANYLVRLLEVVIHCDSLYSPRLYVLWGAPNIGLNNQSNQLS